MVFESINSFSKNLINKKLNQKIIHILKYVVSEQRAAREELNDMGCKIKSLEIYDTPNKKLLKIYLSLKTNCTLESAMPIVNLIFTDDYETLQDGAAEFIDDDYYLTIDSQSFEISENCIQCELSLCKSESGELISFNSSYIKLPEKTKTKDIPKEQIPWDPKKQLNQDLFYACWSGHLDRMKMLIARGADVNLEDYEGITLLMAASLHGDKDKVKLLLDNGADVNAKGKWGKTALMLASRNGHKDIVELLKKYGAKE